jgi:membrane-bound lytic murein transglycosylase B
VRVPRRLALGVGCVVVVATACAAVVGVTHAVSRPDPLLRVQQVRELVAAPAPADVGSSGPRGDASPAWVSRTATATGIPRPAVRAYADATLRLGRSRPACGLSWTTLAGLGWVESQHGTIGGRVLHRDGRPSRPVVGPSLDGADGLAALPASGPRGTSGWQRALGPLQFLQSSWARWRADGDRDGVEDVDDLDDAAYAAGRYLCAGGADLTTGPGWSAALFSYNHAVSYVNAVYAAAQAYADRAP